MSLTAHVPLLAILWDFDGVLNANAPRGRFRWGETFEADFGQPVKGFVDTVFGDMPPLLTGSADIADRVRTWIAETGVDADADSVIAYWLDRDLHLDKKVLDLTERAHRLGLRQAILTNADTRRADWIDAQIADLPQFEAVYASARQGVAKPDPAAFAKAAEAMGLPPGSILFVDDTAMNAQAAGAAGMRGFRYSPLALDALKRRLPRQKVRVQPGRSPRG